jgi:Na+/H+ antiporter NhaD/arsenite permease-like protein
VSAPVHLPPASLEIFWAVAPFVLMLLSLSVLPMLVPHWWESNVNRAKVAGILGLPTALRVLQTAPQRAQETLHEYLSFILVLGTLYVVSSHIVLRGRLSGRPLINTALLAAGAVLASLIGTTGASMLLLRPLVRSNADRLHRTHAVIFFIFIVSNIGGLLTPLGDPPLYLGFMRGVPFFWTLRLWPQWAFGTGYLLAIFYLWDRTQYKKGQTLPRSDTAPLGIEGGWNLLSLAAVVAMIAAAGSLCFAAWLQPCALLGLTAATWFGSPARLRRANAFSWAPLAEVAIVFAGIFATMAPALGLLEAHGGRWLGILGLHSARHFFWATGLLSSALDNAPTYLTASAAASSLCETSPMHLDQLSQHGAGAALLRAISCGAVMMGANTYLGNGPNFMVKAVAEAEGICMPSFFGYMGYSAVVLLPLFGILSAWGF